MASIFAGKHTFEKGLQKQSKIMQEKAVLGNSYILGMDLLTLMLLPLRIINWNQIFVKFRETLFYYLRLRGESGINVHK